MIFEPFSKKMGVHVYTPPFRCPWISISHISQNEETIEDGYWSLKLIRVQNINNEYS